jgi:DHA2 family multidrug resistance protein
MAQAGAQAQGMIYNSVQRQSAMLAFIDNFKMLGVVFLAVIPALLFLKKPKTTGGNVPVH